MPTIDLKRLGLTWHKARGCWRKKYRQKVYYLSRTGECKAPGEDGWTTGYVAALQKWEALKRQIDLQENVAPAPSKAVPVPAQPTMNLDYLKLKEKRSERAPAPAVPTGDTIATLVDEYVSGRRSEAEAGTLSLDSYREAKFKLREFVTYCNQHGLTDPKQITERTLHDYRQCTFDAMTELTPAADRIGPITAHKRLARLKQWLTWLWENRLIDDLPRNLNKFARVSLKSVPKRIDRLGIFSRDELRELYSQAPPRTRCFMALALNVGFTQKDLSTLRHAHVDWKRGRITRNRNKTGRFQYAQLWPITLRLLKEHATSPSTSELLFLGENGKPLITEVVRPNGTPSVTDSVKLTFDRLLVKPHRRWVRENCPELFKRKTEKHPDRCADPTTDHRVLSRQREEAAYARKRLVEQRGFATLRKSGASMLRENFGESATWLVDLYLAHVSNAMRAHYTQQNYTEYDEAIAWLGSYLDFDTVTEAPAEEFDEALTAF